MAIVWPFAIEMWIAVGISLVAVILIYWAFSKLGRADAYGIQFTFWDSCLHIGMVLVIQGVERWPVVWHGKVIMTSWAVCALIIDLGTDKWTNVCMYYILPYPS